MLTVIAGFSHSGKSTLLRKRAAEEYSAVYDGACVADTERLLTVSGSSLFLDDFALQADWRQADRAACLLMRTPTQVTVATHSRDVINRVPLENVIVCSLWEGTFTVVAQETHADAYAMFKQLGLPNAAFLELEFWRQPQRRAELIRMDYRAVSDRWYTQRNGALQLLAATLLRDADLEALAEAGVIESKRPAAWAASMRAQLNTPACYARLVAILCETGFLTNTGPEYPLGEFGEGPVTAGEATQVCTHFAGAVRRISEELNELYALGAARTQMYERIGNVEDRVLGSMTEAGCTEAHAAWAWNVQGGHTLGALMAQIRTFPW